jgi:hypothetical protein
MGRGVTAAVFVAFVAALVMAGCGGSSQKSESTVPADVTISLRTFVAKASQICAAGDKRKSDALEKAAGTKGINVSQGEGEELISNVVLPIYSETNEELAALPVPKGHGREVESIVENVRKSIARSEAEPALALNGKAFIMPDEEISELGIPECIF